MTVWSKNEPDSGRLNDAAVWHAKLQGDAPTDVVWLEFAAWLDADTANRAAFDLVEDLYVTLDEAEPHLLHSDNPAPLARVAALDRWRTARIAPRQAGAIGVALLAASLVVAIGVEMRPAADRTAHYETRIGETRTVTLADGSNIDLNTGSVVDVAFRGTERRVTLGRGEAAFRVAKDPSRPFLVAVGDVDVRDIGTVFNILHEAGRTVVTVAEGRVAVSRRNENAQNGPVQLTAGDQLVMQDAAPDTVRRADPAMAMAWREGYLTYKDAPLTTVVSDLNRYFQNRIVLKDKDTGLRRFSGALKVDNEDAVVSRLAALLPLIIDRDGDGVITLRLKPQAD